MPAEQQFLRNGRWVPFSEMKRKQEEEAAKKTKKEAPKTPAKTVKEPAPTKEATGTKK